MSSEGSLPKGAGDHEAGPVLSQAAPPAAEDPAKAGVEQSGPNYPSSSQSRSPELVHQSAPPENQMLAVGDAATCVGSSSEAHNIQTKEEAGSGQSGDKNTRTTREAVQRVYQMLEKHHVKPATSCEDQEDLSSASSTTSSRASSSSRRGGGGARSQQQPRGARGGGGRQRRANNSRRSQNPSQSSSGYLSAECDTSSSTGSLIRSSRLTDTNDNPSSSSNDPETEEEAQLASLRCPSEATETASERDKRRRKRCADYPGFALGGGLGSIFASDTMMKFSIIQNELHNVINGQLKRVTVQFSWGNNFLKILLSFLLGLFHSSCISVVITNLFIFLLHPKKTTVSYGKS